MLAAERDPSKRLHLQQMVRMHSEFPNTHVAPICVHAARVVSKPQFFPLSSLAVMKRGNSVTVLGSKGSWFRVRTQDGVEGWMHGRKLFPAVVIQLGTGDTGGGTTQGEAETGRRG